MDISKIEEMARRRYNAVGDTNWSTEEIAQIIYLHSLEITRDCGLVLEKRFRSTTVAGTGEYAFPENADSIKRVTYNGKKLKEISMREDDVLTIENQLATDTGDTQYYYQWERTLFLRPIPAGAYTLEVFALCSEQELEPDSTIEIPAWIHGSLVIAVVKEMAAKDLNWQMHDRYQVMWEKDKILIRQKIRRAKRADGFAMVKMEENLPTATLGVK